MTFVHWQSSYLPTEKHRSILLCSFNNHEPSARNPAFLPLRDKEQPKPQE
jgi:hypothetical protein